jgi:hypothetical protein
MDEKHTIAWALQRPTKEIMPVFIRASKTEVLSSLEEHFRDEPSFKHRWRLMKKQGFSIVQVVIAIKNSA